jgi:copper chaperone CopZ
MRKFLITTVTVIVLATPALAETIHVGVNGLVCAFCVKGIENSFKKQAAIDTVNVDLDAKLVTLTTKDAATMDDAKIKEVITEAGYTTTSIHHEK